jgi:osmotically-inducible protein OsmY
MKAQIVGLSLGLFVFAGCATRDVARTDTLNEPSDRFAYLEDRRPPNPNRPTDSPDIKTTPTVVQKDPALDKSKIDQDDKAAERDDKGLAVNSGPDQHVRAQDPTQSDNAPNSAGGPATTQERGTATSADSALAARVREALSTARKSDSNIDPTVASKESNGENKGIQNLEVAAKNGHVTLFGSVKSDADRTAFEQTAARVPGVSSVSNNLVVTKLDKQ